MSEERAVIDFDAYRLVRGFVGNGSRLHLGFVQERAPYTCLRSLCLVGPLDVERSDWPEDWEEMQVCANCTRERRKLQP